MAERFALNAHQRAVLEATLYDNGGLIRRDGGNFGGVYVQNSHVGLLLSQT